MASSPRVARRGRGRLGRSRPTIVAGNTTWEVAKVTGDEQSDEGRQGSSPRHGWQRKMSLYSMAPSQPIGASRAVRGGEKKENR